MRLDGFETQEERWAPATETAGLGVDPPLKIGWSVVALSTEEVDGTNGAMGTKSCASLYQTISLSSSSFPSVPTAHWSAEGMLEMRYYEGESEEFGLAFYTT